MTQQMPGMGYQQTAQPDAMQGMQSSYQNPYQQEMYNPYSANQANQYPGMTGAQMSQVSQMPQMQGMPGLDGEDGQFGDGHPALSVMAGCSLTLGVAALSLSPLFVTSLYAVVFGVVGLIFGIIGLIAAIRKTRRGLPMAIIGTVLSVASIALTVLIYIGIVPTVDVLSETLLISTESSNTNASNESNTSNTNANSNKSSNSNNSSNSSRNSNSSNSNNTNANNTNNSNANSSRSGAASAANANLAIGAAASFADGLTVSVDSVQPGITTADGTPLSQVVVTYINNGNATINYGTIDWKSEDTTGASLSPFGYPEGTNPLVSGNLEPGGSITANVYFADTPVKIFFEPDILGSASGSGSGSASGSGSGSTSSSGSGSGSASGAGAGASWIVSAVV